jgi:hypothetical protein
MKVIQLTGNRYSHDCVQCGFAISYGRGENSCPACRAVQRIRWPKVTIPVLYLMKCTEDRVRYHITETNWD